MSSPKLDQPQSQTRAQRRASDANTPSPQVQEPDDAPDSPNSTPEPSRALLDTRFTSNQPSESTDATIFDEFVNLDGATPDDASDSPNFTPEPSLALLDTRFTSNQPSESTDATIYDKFLDLDGGTPDDTSPVTLKGAFPWHPVDAGKFLHRMPATIAPELLLLSSLEESSDLERESNHSEDGAPRLSASQKGKGKTWGDCGTACGDDAVRSLSPGFHFDDVHNPVEDWVAHSRPILREYADRQTSLPLGRRLNVSMDEPPDFILGAIQLLANRDTKDYTDCSRRLGPQLIENFVDIDCWAKEYLRCHHGLQGPDTDIPALLTIVMNNFYEGLVQLIDRLVEFALQHMRLSCRTHLALEDFSFGFDFKMSQDLPFYVETSSRIRKPVPIHTVDVRDNAETLTTSYGRRVKPTERAQAASEQIKSNTVGKRNKEKSTPDVKDKTAARPIAPLPREKKKKSTQSSSQLVDVPTTSQAKPGAAVPSPSQTIATATRTKYRPVRPPNLGSQPQISGSSSAGTTPAHPNDSSKSKLSASASAVSPKTFDSKRAAHTAGVARPRLTITIPAPSSLSVKLSAENGSESRSKETNGTSQAQTNPVEETTQRRRTLRSGTARPQGPRNCGRGGAIEPGSSTSTAPRAKKGNVNTPHPTAGPLERGGDAGTRGTADPSPGLSSTTLGAEVVSTAGIQTSNARSHRIDRSSDVPGERSKRALQPSPQRPQCPGMFPVLSPDPGHPRPKKRTLDECEE